MRTSLRAVSAIGAAAVVALVACAEGAGDPVSNDENLTEPGSDASTIVKPSQDGASPIDAAVDSAPPDGGDACAEALAKVSFDFESGAQGFTHGISDGVSTPPDWPFDPWAQGTSAVGTACKSGKCFGTELTKNYAQCQRGYLLSPKVNLSACKGRKVSLVFQHAFGFWSGTYGGQSWSDGGVVEISGDDGATWQSPQGTYPGTVRINPNRGAFYECTQPDAFGVHEKQGFVGKQPTTTRVELALPAAALTAAVRVRFSVASGVSSSTSSAESSRSATDFGWRIDDVGFALK